MPFRLMRAVLSVAAFVAGGCVAPKPLTVDALGFPVLVLFEHNGTVRHDDAGDLRKMSVQRVMNSNSAPFLIDSRMDVYRLEKLASVHGGMWLMANPSSQTEVTFELARVAKGDAALARRLITEREPRLRHDSDPALVESLNRADTFAAMLSAIGK